MPRQSWEMGEGPERMARRVGKREDEEVCWMRVFRRSAG